VFIATKFNPARNDAAAEVERSLQRLGADYVDLYLVHWPQGGATRAWPGIERARVLSYARSIGVSNFGARELDTLLAAANVPPVVDQVQFNPSEYRRGLLDATLQRAIVAEAYSPGWGAAMDRAMDPREAKTRGVEAVLSKPRRS
jgi:diketogulonate reductase-like aldo/keto reductase